MCAAYAGLSFGGASYSRNAFDTSLPTQINTLRRVWNTSTGKAIALGRVHQDDVSAVAVQVSVSRPRGCSRYSSGDLYVLPMTNINAGGAGYRKQSVCCGRSIRCDAHPAHIAVHLMPFCEKKLQFPYNLWQTAKRSRASRLCSKTHCLQEKRWCRWLLRRSWRKKDP
jgi:hypothetical protein